MKKYNMAIEICQQYLVHDDKNIVRTTGGETSTRINNIYDILTWTDIETN